MTADSGRSGGEGTGCWAPCDPDCELGAAHCVNLHQPMFKWVEHAYPCPMMPTTVVDTLQVRRTVAGLPPTSPSRYTADEPILLDPVAARDTIDETLGEHFVMWHALDPGENGPHGEWRCMCGLKFGFSATAITHQRDSLLAALASQERGE